MTMQFDFDSVYDRRGSGSLKWDLPKDEGVIPLWVADMDFKTAPCVTKALKDRVEHGIFGYEMVPEAWYEAIASWLLKRCDLRIDKDWLIPVPGAVPALSAALKAITLPGDQVITFTPAYNCFFSSIRNTGCELSPSHLLWQNGSWKIDFKDLKEKASQERARAILLCNPHNPTGRLWTGDELEQIASIACDYDLYVISDEIHSDIRPQGSAFTSLATIDESFRLKSVILNAPSKAFNLAGCQNAYMLIKDPDLRERCDRAVNINEVCDVNPFGVAATIAAYNEGSEWLDAMNAYIRENLNIASGIIKKELSKAAFSIPDAGYLLWLDLKAYGKSSEKLFETMLKHKVMLNRGTDYGPAEDGFMRLNTACPRALLEEGLSRVVAAVKDPD